MIDWHHFFANGGYSNENSDPRSYDDGSDCDEEENCDEWDEWDIQCNNYSKDDC